MRNIIPVVLLSWLSQNATAQGRRGLESHLILKAGYNLANITMDNNGRVDKSNQLSGFHAGLMCDLPLSKFLSFQGGLIYTTKGAKTEFGTVGEIGHFTAKTDPQYIELPLDLAVKIPLGFKNAPKIIFGAGPYFALGIAGSNKTQIQAANEIIYSNKQIDYDAGANYPNPIGYPTLKRFDYGVNAQAGIELKGLILTVNYDYGLAKLVPGTVNSADDKGKNRVLFFSVGIKL